jgi:hypothetical protein
MTAKTQNLFTASLMKQNADAKLVKAADLLTGNDLKMWLNTIDESAYSLDEWMESLILFKAWTIEQKRELDFSNQLEYLSCCAESARGGVKLPLPFLLKEFLRTNGVE